MSILAVDRRAWHSLFAAQIGWMLDAMDFLFFTFAVVLYSLATAGLATATAPWQLAVWRTLVGLGMGGEWSCGSVLVAETWPAEHRGKAMGLVQSGWAIGALIAAALSAFTPVRYGWRVLFLTRAA